MSFRSTSLNFKAVESIQGNNWKGFDMILSTAEVVAPFLVPPNFPNFKSPHMPYSCRTLSRCTSHRILLCNEYFLQFHRMITRA
jgi:hypothetical protein